MLAYGGVSLVITLAAASGAVLAVAREDRCRSVLPRVDDLGIDGTVLAFSLAAACVDCPAVRAGPAVHRTRGSYIARDRGGDGAATSGLSLFSRQRGRGVVLVVAQLAMATVLLIGAGVC